jgi:hypothetical protein
LNKGADVLPHAIVSVAAVTVILFLFTRFDTAYFLVARAVAYLVLVYVLPVFGMSRLI